MLIYSLPNKGKKNTSVRSFLQELTRRNVFKVTAAYAAFAWILVSVADILLPVVGAPDWTMPTLLLMSVIGVPLAAPRVECSVTPN
ncbi:MAG: hypothetical protein AAF438_02855 [Pseudomonadota bacterium]